MRWLTVSMTVLLIMTGAGCTEPGMKANPSAQEQTAQTNGGPLEPGQLPDIRQVLLEDDGSVTLVNGAPDRLMLVNAAGEVADAVNLQVGQQCVLSDGRHVSITYKLINVNGYELTFEVTGRFDARAFGDDVRTHRKVVTILPYQKQTELWQ